MKIETEVENLKATNISTGGDEFVIENASLIMGYISDQMYSFPVRTTVQEYLSNARDAMVAIGNTADKIIITAPTPLNPNFSVRDFGISMTHEHMVGVFRKYGASDKRHTDSAIGGWGLGSKIAWSTVDSFTIVCYLGGEKRTYLAHKGVNNNGMLSAPIYEGTEQSNGVEIIIPVSQDNLYEYKRAIERSILFCREEVEAQGLLPEEISTVEFTEVAEDFLIARKGDINKILGLDSWSDNPIAVIAGVPYVISKGNSCLDDVENILKDYISVFIVKTGDLDIPVQREALKYSDKTIDGLEAIGEWALENLKRYVANQFEACNSPKEFFDLYRETRKTFRFGSIVKPEYDVYNIKDGRVHSNIMNKVKLQKVHNKSKKYPHHRIQRITRLDIEDIDIDELSSVFYIDDRHETKVKQNRRIRTHLETNKHAVLLSAIYPEDGDVVVPTPEGELSPAEVFLKIIDDFGIEPISSVPMIETAQRERNSPGKGTIKIHSFAYGKRRINNLDLSEIEDKFLYATMEDGQPPYNNLDIDNITRFAKLRDEKTVCVLSITNAKKIKNNESFQPLEDWINSYVATDQDYDSVRFTQYSSEHVDRAKKNIAMIKEVFAILGTDFINKNFRSNMDWIEDNDFKTDSCDYIPDLILSRMNVEALKAEAEEFIEKCQEFTTLFDNSFPLLKKLHCYEWDNNETKKEIAFYMKAKLDS